MKKILYIIQNIINILSAIFAKKPRVVDTGDKNVDTIKAALDMADANKPEVADAIKKIDEISKMPEEEREEHQDEIKEAEKIVIDEIKAKDTEGDPEKQASLLDQFRKAEEKKHER